MFKRIALAVILAIAFTSAVAAQGNANAMSEESMGGAEAANAIARLGDLSPIAIRGRLKQMRGPARLPIPSVEKRIVEAQGLTTVANQRVEQLKAVLKPVMDYHERGQIPVHVLWSEKPKAYFVDRAVLFITSRLLHKASDEDIRGIVAHELAHEYVWDEGVKASKEKDGMLMREIELFCDAVAAFTLKETGGDPASYLRTLERLTLISIQAGLSRGREEETHPSLEARKKLNKFLCQRFTG